MTDKVADKPHEFVSIEQRARLKAHYLPKFKKVRPKKAFLPDRK